MLVACLNGRRICAQGAERGLQYLCPQCQSGLILKRGRKVIDHFAHKPPTDCTWAAGETRAHLEAKYLVAASFSNRGLRAEVEHVVETLLCDRRADVMLWSPDELLKIAFELQHTPIGLNEIEARSASYAAAGIAQIWIPFLRKSVWQEGAPCAGGWFVQRYSPRPFERWVHGLNGKRGMWMYDPVEKNFWLGYMRGYELYVEGTKWYSEGGEEHSGGDFYRWSKRFKELTLRGPYNPVDLLVSTSKRGAYKTPMYSWPAGRVARFVPNLASDSAMEGKSSRLRPTP